MSSSLTSPSSLLKLPIHANGTGISFPTGRSSVCCGKFAVEPRVPFAFKPAEPEILPKWKVLLVFLYCSNFCRANGHLITIKLLVFVIPRSFRRIDRKFWWTTKMTHQASLQMTRADICRWGDCFFNKNIFKMVASSLLSQCSLLLVIIKRWIWVDAIRCL